jgi:hypothetical protein
MPATVHNTGPVMSMRTLAVKRLSEQVKILLSRRSRPIADACESEDRPLPEFARFGLMCWSWRDLESFRGAIPPSNSAFRVPSQNL